MKGKTAKESLTINTEVVLPNDTNHIGNLFGEFVEREWEKYHIDYYINFGGNLNLLQWRTWKPELIFISINHIISHRLGAV